MHCYMIRIYLIYSNHVRQIPAGRNKFTEFLNDWISNIELSYFFRIGSIPEYNLCIIISLKMNRWLKYVDRIHGIWIVWQIMTFSLVNVGLCYSEGEVSHKGVISRKRNILYAFLVEDIFRAYELQFTNIRTIRVSWQFWIYGHNEYR